MAEEQGKKKKILYVITKSNWGGAKTLQRFFRNPRFLTASPVFLLGKTTVSPSPFRAPPQLLTIH